MSKVTLAKPKVTPDVLECIARQIDDSLTWCRFAQVSRKTKQITDRLLIKIKVIEPASYLDYVESLSGKICEQCILPGSNGRRHGTYKVWHYERSQLAAIGYFKDDVHHGKMCGWDELGRPTSSLTFKEGKIIGKHETWDYRCWGGRDGYERTYTIFYYDDHGKYLRDVVYNMRRSVDSYDNYEFRCFEPYKLVHDVIKMPHHIVESDPDTVTLRIFGAAVIAVFAVGVMAVLGKN